MSRNERIYHANRLVLGLRLALVLSLASLAAWPPLLDYLHDIRFYRWAAKLNSIPGDVRVMVCLGLAGILVVIALMILRWIVDNRLVTTDASGIEIRTLFGVQRAAWRDYAGAEPGGLTGVGTPRLLFRPAGDGIRSRRRRRLRLPSRLLGYDPLAVMVDVIEREAKLEEPPLKVMIPQQPLLEPTELDVQDVAQTVGAARIQ